MIMSLKEKSITFVVGGQISESSSDKINQKLDKIGYVGLSYHELDKI